MTRSPIKEGLHPRNRFRARYDFEQLVEGHPSLVEFVARNAHGDLSIDHANPDAVKALNQALLHDAYGIEAWDIPPGSLCPPAPGRSDYLHHVADLLAEGGDVPRGPSVRVLDIGVGASCIYPLIGASEYGWSFVGTDIDPAALRWARQLVKSNVSVADRIECRLQPSASATFSGVILPGELFALSICNPPFHSSAEEATEATRRKLRNLGGRKVHATVRNFGGQAGELWCEGGELGFIRRLISQSAAIPRTCSWFTTLVSKSDHLRRLHQALENAKALDVRTLEMTQGQKKSRILAWTFMSTKARRERLA